MEKKLEIKSPFELIDYDTAISEDILEEAISEDIEPRVEHGEPRVIDLNQNEMQEFCQWLMERAKENASLSMEFPDKVAYTARANAYTETIEKLMDQKLWVR